MMDLIDKYRAAEKMLPWNTRKMVLNGCPQIRWTGPDEFTYTRQVRVQGGDGYGPESTVGDGMEEVTVLVSALTGEEKICREDGTVSRSLRPGSAVPQSLRPGSVVPQSAGSTIPMSPVTMSPDGRYGLFTREHNLYLREKDGAETQLTSDGEALCGYGCYVDIYSQVTVKRQGYVEHPLVVWSPDSRYFITYRADRRKVKSLYLIESYSDSAWDVRPRLREYPCPFAVDSDEELPHFQLFVGDVKEKKMVMVDAPPYLDPVFTSGEKSFVRWLDCSSFYFTWFGRGYQEGRLYLAEAGNGRTRLIVRERTDTFLNLGAFGQLDGFGSYQFSNFVTTDRKLAFWQSERSGYAHLYRYNVETGDCEGDLFPESGRSLIVQKLVKVDEGSKKIYFMANHVPECSDPLYYQLYVVSFDGKYLKRLTPEDAVHQVSMGEHTFVDTYSRVDAEPVTVIRALDGTLIRELERADVTGLLANGYRYPERFTVLADDGVTLLYGILVRPSGFEAGKEYPVIDYVYGGAQLYNVPRGFTWDNAMGREVMGGLQEFAQLGFAGIILDGRGTPGRGKAFHDFSWKGIHECAGLRDHVSCLPALKERFPFLDLKRVGIWGNSGGGYATVSAMLQYPDVYKAGVASAGNYDQRMYENSWTERYYGRYEEELYGKGDISRLASNLKGKLFLACGAMDDNVSMSQTLRLCDRLIQNNKDYEFLILPRANHNVPGDLYFIRRKLDFFVRHLLGEEPPEFEFKDAGQGGLDETTA